MNKKYIINLTEEEQNQLKILIKKGKGAVYRIKHANIMLKADANGPNWSDEKIAQAFHCHLNTVRNIRQRFVQEGFEVALNRQKQQALSRAKKLDGAGEARLIAISCSQPPEGHGRWTLKLLAKELVVLEIVDSICEQTVRRTLKKTNCGLT